ncbi:hypothetical protein OROHE_026623 [Orobanche hederae]
MSRKGKAPVFVGVRRFRRHHGSGVRRFRLNHGTGVQVGRLDHSIGVLVGRVSVVDAWTMVQASRSDATTMVQASTPDAYTMVQMRGGAGKSMSLVRELLDSGPRHTRARGVDTSVRRQREAARRDHVPCSDFGTDDSSGYYSHDEDDDQDIFEGGDDDSSFDLCRVLSLPAVNDVGHRMTHRGWLLRRCLVVLSTVALSRVSVGMLPDIFGLER